MRRLMLFLALLWSVPLTAQTLPPSPQSLTAQFSSTCTATSCATFLMAPIGASPTAAVTLSITGTFTGTLDFEGSVDGSTFVSISLTKLSDGSSATSTTAAGQFAIGNSGFLSIRVKATALSAGGANVWAVRGGGTPKNLTPFLTRLYTGDGTCPLPAWSFASDTDLGVYRVGANNLAFCAGSVNLLDINSTRLLGSVPFIASDGSASAPSLSFASSTNTGFFLQGLGVARLALAGTGVYEFAATTLSFLDDTATIRLGASSDVRLTRDAADALALRRGTNAQEQRWYQSYTDASNYSRIRLYYDGSTRFILTTEAAGTGVVKGLLIGPGTGGALGLASDGGTKWSIPTTGHFLAQTDNTYDLGASGATRPRTGYFGTSVVSPILQGSGTGVTVANVGANSCGTTAATIAGNQLSGKVTIGATAGTQCRLTFSTAAPVSRDCTVNDETTTIAARATYVDSTNTDLFGAFVAGDVVTYQCTVR